MTDKPFNFEIQNSFNETIYKTVPTVIGTQNVVLEQAAKRTITDLSSTCVRSTNIQPEMSTFCKGCNNCAQPHASNIQTHAQYVPGGVSFTFSALGQNDPFSSKPQQTLRKNGYQTQCSNTAGFIPQSIYLPTNQIDYSTPPLQNNLTLQDLITCNKVEKNGGELYYLQENMKQLPCRIDFHYNKKTSTTDLLNGKSQTPISMAFPDFRNLCSMMDDFYNIQGNQASKLPCNCPCNLNTNIRKRLYLSRSPDLKPFNEEDMYNLGKDQTKCLCPNSHVQNPTTEEANQVTFNNGTENNIIYTNTAAEYPNSNAQPMTLLNKEDTTINPSLPAENKQTLTDVANLDITNSTKGTQLSVNNHGVDNFQTDVHLLMKYERCSCQTISYPEVTSTSVPIKSSVTETEVLNVNNSFHNELKRTLYNMIDQHILNSYEASCSTIENCTYRREDSISDKIAEPTKSVVDKDMQVSTSEQVEDNSKTTNKH